MFDDIEKISWEKLKQAHGNSEHVPNAIKGLISDNEKEQEASYWKLDNNVVLQGDLYQAALYVVPFLLEILATNIQNGRKYVYDLLFEIANGYAPKEVTCNYQGAELPLTEGCKIAIAGGLNLFLGEIADSDSACRENALGLIVSLEKHAERILPELVKIKNKETDLEFRDQLEEAVSEIGNSGITP